MIRVRSYTQAVATAPTRVRLAELVATISLGTDLGLGQPMQHVIRQTIIALRMADLLDLDEAEREVVYYAGLLAWVGCHTDAYEQSKWFGDDIAMKRDAMFTGPRKPEFARFLAGHVGAGASMLERVRTGLAFPREGMRWFSGLLHTHWQAADLFAERLGLGEDVRRSLRESYEWWNGRGLAGLAGEQIRLTSRAGLSRRRGGRLRAARRVRRRSGLARERRGNQFDPGLVDLFCRHATKLLAGLDADRHWPRSSMPNPVSRRTCREQGSTTCLEAMGDFADLKSPCSSATRGRSPISRAGPRGCSASRPTRFVAVRRAALVHDIGRLGVSNAVWDKQGPLTLTETERVRMHPYLTERMLASSPGLAGSAPSPYSTTSGSTAPATRAASPATRSPPPAGCWRRLTVMRRSPRSVRTGRRAPRRGGHGSARRRTRGRLDGPAAEAVLTAAGHHVRRKGSWPAGLTTGRSRCSACSPSA